MNILKTSLRFWLMLAAAALAAMSFTGCVAVVAGAAGAGTVAYVNGELDSNLAANYEQAVTATERAIRQLQFVTISENKDALTAHFVVRTAEDRKIEIHVLKISDQASKVQIRVGFFSTKSNKALSLTILEKIKQNL